MLAPDWRSADRDRETRFGYALVGLRTWFDLRNWREVRKLLFDFGNRRKAPLQSEYQHEEWVQSLSDAESVPVQGPISVSVPARLGHQATRRRIRQYGYQATRRSMVDKPAGGGAQVGLRHPGSNIAVGQYRTAHSESNHSKLNGST
eukprot:1041335-Rhodomonas_salina.1